MKNYDMIVKAINDILTRMYKAMNDYLENILNAPSTINRIFKYYSIGVPEDITLHERYILFKGTVIRTYVIEEPNFSYHKFMER